MLIHTVSCILYYTASFYQTPVVNYYSTLTVVLSFGCSNNYKYFFANIEETLTVYISFTYVELVFYLTTYNVEVKKKIVEDE